MKLWEWVAAIHIGTMVGAGLMLLAVEMTKPTAVKTCSVKP